MHIYLCGRTESLMRGLALERFLAVSGWHVLNKTGNSHIFATINGFSNIDVTLANPKLCPLIGDWRVEGGLIVTTE